MDYQTGFGNHFASEAVPGALPVGRNSPQKPAFGLYAEQFSTTAFTAPRDHTRRSWLYRMRPATSHAAFRPLRPVPAPLTPASPNRLRWSPLALPDAQTYWIDGLVQCAGN